MFRDVLCCIALTVAVSLLVYFMFQVFYHIVLGKFSKGISMVFLIKNQQDMIEGVIRKVYSESNPRPIELIAVDLNSEDETVSILKKLADDFDTLKIINFNNDRVVYQNLKNFCSEKTIYCFNLTGNVDYNVIVQSIKEVFLWAGPEKA